MIMNVENVRMQKEVIVSNFNVLSQKSPEVAQKNYIKFQGILYSLVQDTILKFAEKGLRKPQRCQCGVLLIQQRLEFIISEKDVRTIHTCFVCLLGI